MLKVYDSLSREKKDFVLETNEREIKWYTCGPTVYDASHIGHARNYVSFDIIRRILEGYFGYSVMMVMNITDIDDKIIKKSNEEHIDFKILAKKWEIEFMNDMKMLDVIPPTVLTRVSDFIPEIIEFIEKLVNKKIAYISNNSVYFDIEEYKKSNIYGKLKNIHAHSNDISDVDEELEILEKRNKSDFALWKKAKEFEPYWDSPFGKGRPGWHIECSAMASYILGDQMDIHSGGEDLKFPHHENEIAQSQAYFNIESTINQDIDKNDNNKDKRDWVRYFLHSGHLHIQGSKMSKSLKNFITIKDALTKYSSRQLRLLFVLHNVNNTLDYSEDSMNYAISIDKSIHNFFQSLDMLKLTDNEKWTPAEFELYKEFKNLKLIIDSNLKDNFNTSDAINNLMNFTKNVNKYIKGNYVYKLVITIKEYYNKITSLFGLNYTSQNLSNNNEDAIIDVLVSYRNDIRVALKNKNISEIYKLSDQLRDNNLPSLNIKLIDTVSGNSSWTRF